MDPGLNSLLKWSIENTPATENGAAPPPTSQGLNELNQEALAALLGGPSDADLMRAAMVAITSGDTSVTLEDKLIAFDNFEQLIESLDNANNLARLALWEPLLGCLAYEQSELRKMAAWCVGTAVQNNEPSQEALLAAGGVPRLVALAKRQGEDREVRRKAIYALSSACRNYQPAMDVCLEELAKAGRTTGKVDAHDMEAVDTVINELKAEAIKA